MRRNSRETTGLCWDCAHVRQLDSAKGSAFYQCGRARQDDAYALYPALPVMDCSGYRQLDPNSEPASPGDEAEADEGSL